MESRIKEPDQVLGHLSRNHVVNGSAESGHFLDDGTAEEAVSGRWARKTVSSWSARDRLVWAICNSYSKSLMARESTQDQIGLMGHRAVDGEPVKINHFDPVEVARRCGDLANAFLDAESRLFAGIRQHLRSPRRTEHWPVRSNPDDRWSTDRNCLGRGPAWPATRVN